MSVSLSSVKLSAATVVKDAKTVVTVIGGVLAILSQVVPVVPAADQHWVLGAVAFLTVLARDITDVVNDSTSA